MSAPTTTSPSRSPPANCWRACARCCAGADATSASRRRSTIGPLRIDFARRRVTIDDEEVKLTRKEFDVLALLARQAGRLRHPPPDPARRSGDRRTKRDTHYLRIVVGHLRDKLGDDAANPRFILTEPGVGYRLTI